MCTKETFSKIKHYFHMVFVQSVINISLFIHWIYKKIEITNNWNMKKLVQIEKRKGKINHTEPL